MPEPTLAEQWRGHAPTTDEPGGYRIYRTIPIDSALGLIEVNIRDAAYGGASDVPSTVQAGAQVRGMLRFVGVFNNSSVAGENVSVGFSTSGAPPAAFDPVTAYQVALTNGPGLALRVPVTPETTSVFLQAAVGVPTVQVELWFDVPPAA